MKLQTFRRCFQHRSLLKIDKPSIFDLLESSSQRVKQFQFIPSAAALAKNKSMLALPLNLLSKSSGEDAYFTRHDSLGIADGVGGWTSVKGANPALYSLLLMHYAALEFNNYYTPDLESDPLPISAGNRDLNFRATHTEIGFGNGLFSCKNSRRYRKPSGKHDSSDSSFEERPALYRQCR